MPPSRSTDAPADASAVRQVYDGDFYADLSDVSARSAQAVVPLLIEQLAPESVIDVGCGLGTWLAAFVANGVADATGVEAGAVPAELLRVPASSVSTIDLRRRLEIDRRFDLAISLEVAEHLPASRADSFVEDLTSLAPVVVFSAAVPLQGGTGHLNEQWQSYWATRFRNRGYRASTVLRSRMWDDDRIASYYAQNLVVYASEQRAAELPALFDVERDAPLDVVHPRLWDRRARHPLLAALSARLPEGVKNAATQRLRPHLKYLRDV